jgi:predicted TIM-barrel fold metal-dependent hydrolase
MKRRTFLQTALAGGGLAAFQSCSGSAQAKSADRQQTPAPTDVADDREPREPIIDVHMHAYPADAEIPAQANPVTGKIPDSKNGEAHLQACLAEMKRLNIVKGVVSGGGGDRLAAAAHWRDTAPDRFVAAAGIRGSAEVPLPDISVLRKAFEEGRLSVLGEVTAQYAGLTLSDPKYDSYLALAEQFGIPVAVHTGMGPPGISYDPCCRGFRASLGNPGLIEDALNRHPKLRVSLMHAGWPYLDATLATMFVYPQVNVDLGAIDWALPRAEFHAYLQALVRAGFGKRVMFGSDQMYWPEAIGMAVEAVESAIFLTRSAKRDIFYGNAVRFLRLEEMSKGTTP